MQHISTKPQHTHLSQVVFDEGVAEVIIILIVQPDLLPELNEETVIELTEITQNGVPPGSDESRGAQFIPGKTQSVVTVQANDAPHGVLVWSAARVEAAELDGVDGTVQLTILREFGSIGAILITYRSVQTLCSQIFKPVLLFMQFNLLL